MTFGILKKLFANLKELILLTNPIEANTDLQIKTDFGTNLSFIIYQSLFLVYYFLYNVNL